ncbi:MAG TPA: carboxypeptidase-like regulatory domain-containing protein, partial [Planctomycetota bacterium]|nr:carboxypeptidase-like regulatory domain-containing protein [Planctomycetota bacterium]
MSKGFTLVLMTLAALLLALCVRLALQGGSESVPAAPVLHREGSARQERGSNGPVDEAIVPARSSSRGERSAVSEASDSAAHAAVACRLSGIVRRALCSEPVVGAVVHVYPRSGGLDLERDHAASMRDRTIRYGRTDAAGRFDVQGLSGGVYAAIAMSGFGRSAVEVVQLTPARPIEITLELPPAASLEGKVLGPPEASFAGLAIRLETSDPRHAYDTHLNASGSFAFANVPTGTALVSLGVEETRIDLGSLELTAGRNFHYFDLTERFPGYLVVRVRQRGMPARNLTLLTAPAEPGTHYSGRAMPLPEDGVLRVGPLQSGPWRIDVQSKDGGWSTRSLGLAHVEPAGESVFDVDVWIARGMLQVFDEASGVPLASSTVMVRSTELGYGKAHRSDAGGW